MGGIGGATGGGGGGSRAAGAAGGALSGAALGTAVAPGIGTAVGAVAGGVLGAIAAGSDDSALRPGAIPDISAGGLRLLTEEAGDAGLQFTVFPGGFGAETRRRAVRGISAQFGRLSREFAGLREQVGPGFRNVLQSRLSSIRNARTRAIGTISENLAQRRVLGSSFGQAAIAQAEREFAEAEATARAQTFLEQIDVESQLIAQESSAAINAFNTELAELDVQLGLAAGSLGPLTSAVTSLANTNALLAAESARGTAAFGAQAGGTFGGILEQVFTQGPATQTGGQQPIQIARTASDVFATAGPVIAAGR